MDERDEQEIETRLRAALLARTDLVTHQRLRPGVPPNAHTAGLAQGRRRGWAVSWRSLLVPVTVAAALAGGVFVGAALPGDSSGTTVSAGSGPAGGTGAPTSPATTAHQPATPPPPTAAEANFAGLAFDAGDWQFSTVSDTTACLLPVGHVPADPTAALPCGVDALTIQTGAAAASWTSRVTDKTGWWPAAGTAEAAVPCPAGKPSAKNPVKTSSVLRTDAKYPLAQTATAAYTEWTVTCADGTGVVPQAWSVTKSGAKSVVVSDLSVNPRYDADMLRIVSTMHPTDS